MITLNRHLADMYTKTPNKWITRMSWCSWDGARPPVSTMSWKKWSCMHVSQHMVPPREIWSRLQMLMTTTSSRKPGEDVETVPGKGQMIGILPAAHGSKKMGVQEDPRKWSRNDDRGHVPAELTLGLGNLLKASKTRTSNC